MAQTGIIFDCDGTLLDSMAAWVSIEDRFARSVGTRLDKAEHDFVCAATIPEVCSFFHERYGLGSSSSEVYAMIDESMLDFYANRVSARPGALEFMQDAKCGGARCSVASSSPRRYLLAGLDRVGMMPYLDAVFSVEDVGASKRERVIFDAARDAMASDVNATWGIDDAAYAIRTLKGAGYGTVGIYDCDRSGTFDQLSALADIAVRSFAEIDPSSLSRF